MVHCPEDWVISTHMLLAEHNGTKIWKNKIQGLFLLICSSRSITSQGNENHDNIFNFYSYAPRGA